MHFKKLGVLNQDPPLPTTMGKWQCLFPQSKPIEWLKGNVIGSGSFGTVRMAINTATGSLFVVKSAKSKGGIASLHNEADLLHNLDSPHIIKCMGEDSKAANGETKYSLFFEYMSGGSISDVAQKFGGALNEKLIRLYTREILQGLKFLHQNRIVHCDVKCKNILLSASGAVKIADFGCAKRLSSDCKASLKGMGGTPLWMAPEVVRNEELSVAADIWSLGCTVIEMATGRPPWGGDALNPMTALLKIANGDEVPEFPGHFSPEGRDFLAKCLERDPRKRWTSEELLGHPFVAYNSIKEDTLSPTSVLDVASYDSDVSDDDDDDGDDECVNRVPFLLKCCWEEKNGSDNVLETSGSWITVRSR